jgi:MoaA/NifB/PqqE/SkfB family radical SAM enzyme
MNLKTHQNSKLALGSQFFLMDKIRFAWRRICSLFNNRLLVISFEVTLSCNCNCHHCDLGGFKKEEKQIQPKDYARIVRELKPLVVQLSGGEALLRPDIVDIVKATKQFGKLPYVILVTNGVLLNEKIYRQLLEAGLNQLSISLDFPDERHDEFRRHPGLFRHLEGIVPKLAKYGFNNIILNSAITRANFRELVPLAKKAIEWGVLISYSAYTPLRTGNKEYAFEDAEDLKALRKSIKRLIEFKKKTNCIVNSKTVLLKTLKFLEEGCMPNCKAGLKFVVVMPDGSFVPCSMKRYKFSTLEELRKKFSQSNSCDGCCGCYVSIRCYSERSLFEELKEIPEYLKVARGSIFEEKKIFV